MKDTHFESYRKTNQTNYSQLIIVTFGEEKKQTSHEEIEIILSSNIDQINGD